MAGAIKENKFSEGVTVTMPEQKFITAGNMPAYADDASFVTAKGAAAVEGDFYGNTTLHRIRYYNGTAWITVGLQPINEVPTGVVDGNNDTFTLSQTPAVPSAVLFFVNGNKQLYTTEFSVSGTTITTVVAPALGQKLEAYYLY